MHQERSQDDPKHPKTDLKLSKRNPQEVQGFQNETIRGPKGPLREPRIPKGSPRAPKGVQSTPTDSQNTPKIGQNDPKGPKKKPRYFKE